MKTLKGLLSICVRKNNCTANGHFDFKKGDEINYNQIQYKVSRIWNKKTGANTTDWEQVIFATKIQ